MLLIIFHRTAFSFRQNSNSSIRFFLQKNSVKIFPWTFFTLSVIFTWLFLPVIFIIKLIKIKGLYIYFSKLIYEKIRTIFLSYSTPGWTFRQDWPVFLRIQLFYLFQITLHAVYRGSSLGGEEHKVMPKWCGSEKVSQQGKGSGDRNKVAMTLRG